MDEKKDERERNKNEGGKEVKSEKINIAKNRKHNVKKDQPDEGEHKIKRIKTKKKQMRKKPKIKFTNDKNEMKNEMKFSNWVKKEPNIRHEIAENEN